jgi:death-on-curing protein
MKHPIWLNINHVLAFHSKQIHEHGGSHGIRDKGLLESALARPQQLFNYAKPSIFELAACYAYAITKNHPFVDGNKRTGIVTAGVFLQINGFFLETSEPEVVNKVTALADGSIDEREFSEWLTKVSHPKNRDS